MDRNTRGNHKIASILAYPSSALVSNVLMSVPRMADVFAGTHASPIKPMNLSLYNHDNNQKAFESADKFTGQSIKTTPMRITQEHKKPESVSSVQSSRTSKKDRSKKELTLESRLNINARERKRMHDLNDSLDELRSVIPLYAHGSSVRKLSKISTLKFAKNYISIQATIIDELRKELAFVLTNVYVGSALNCPTALPVMPTNSLLNIKPKTAVFGDEASNADLQARHKIINQLQQNPIRR
jgi:hypothetical protein